MLRAVPLHERSLGRYTLLHELGSGELGTVFLGRDDVGRLVAIRRVHHDLARDPDLAAALSARLDAYAQAVARISHHNVCKIYGLERDSGYLFLVMEYVHGESMDALLARLAELGERLPLEGVLHLAAQACLALHAAHEQTEADGHAVVHGDCRPGNLLISYEGEVKLLDHGLAAAAAMVQSPARPPYQAPEQGAGDAVDQRTDIYALGVVLDQLLRGAVLPPPDALTASPWALTDLTAATAPPPEAPRTDDRAGHAPPGGAPGRDAGADDRATGHQLPPEIVAIVTTATAAVPGDRFATAADMYRELYAYLVASPRSTTARDIGEQMRRLFAIRYARREELRALALAAPEILAGEELELDLRRTPRPKPRLHCDYCGAPLASTAAQQAHLEQCSQRLWWERNFGAYAAAQSLALATVPDGTSPTVPAPGWPPPPSQPGGYAPGQRRPYSTTGAFLAHQGPPPPTPPPGLLQALRASLQGSTRDPLIARLGTIASRLATVRDQQAAVLADRTLGALWGMATLVLNHSPRAELLTGIKPHLLACANGLLAMALEIDSSAGYLAALSEEELRRQLAYLQQRAAGAASAAVRAEIERGQRAKESLLAERQRVAQRLELLRLRLEAMVDKAQLSHARVLRIASSPAMAHPEADTQIAVFFDALAREVEITAESLDEVEEALAPQPR